MPEDRLDHAWTCSCCGKQFNTLPLDWSFDHPYPWFTIPEEERSKRCKIDGDICMIDEDEIYIRGCLEIPVIDHDDKFVWGVWCSVSKESFARIQELQGAPVIENEPPRFGWLCNKIAIYPEETMSLKTHIHLRGGGKRPMIELEPTEHPLAIEQRQGITIERVLEIAAASHRRH